MKNNRKADWLVALIGLLETAIGSWACTARLSVLIIVFLAAWSALSTPTRQAIIATAKIIYRSVA